MRQIAIAVGISGSTAARICRQAGLSRLRHLDPPLPVIRYERDHPGELLHIDIKRLGRFDRVGHRITRKRSFGSKKQGFEFVYVAVDDASRLSYVQILADERSEAACAFLTNAVAWFAQQDVRIERVMTDNGSAFLSRQFREHCGTLAIRHLRTRPYTPAHERESRAVHPNAVARVGVPLLLQQLSRAKAMAHAVCPLLQLSPPPLSTRIQSADQSLGSEQRPETQQLVGGRDADDEQRRDFTPKLVRPGFGPAAELPASSP